MPTSNQGKTLWGFSPDEKLSLDDMLKVKYQGIRPAPGYPSQPDHREKKTLWDLLEVDRLTDNKIELTESYMMMPSASVSALVFAHPEAKYFSVGQVNTDQVKSYAERRGETGVEDTLTQSYLLRQTSGGSLILRLDTNAAL
eukprot:g259.t1